MTLAYASVVHIEAAREAYRRYAGFYDALFGPVLQPGRRAVMKALGCRPGERILEVGVGTGLSLPMYPPWVRITGIDVSREMLEKARQRVTRETLDNVDELLEMDAEHLSFGDGSFDRVVAMYVVSVVQHPERVMAELRRVCRPGGEILVVNHVRSSNPLLGAVEKSLAPLSAKLGWHPDFELEKITATGGTLLEMRTVGVLWKVLRFRNA
ncbi:MAG TPA: methyltransferase domain-containing protein [Burkholderiales bacterium]|nr:methyltransferase domain-containing protein [Burkholderiales bacterium]